MKTLEACIRFWQRILFDFSFLMEPGTRSQIELTITLLKELSQKRRG